MTRPVDTDERNTLALDLLLTSVQGRPLPDPAVADREAASAVALADAFLDATLAPPADLDDAPDPDPHGLIEYAIAFAPTVHIGNAIVPVYLMEEADEAFRFQGRRAALLGLAGLEFDNPDEAFDELRRVEAEQAGNVELGAQLLAPAPPVEAEAPRELTGAEIEECARAGYENASMVGTPAWEKVEDRAWWAANARDVLGGWRPKDMGGGWAGFVATVLAKAAEIRARPRPSPACEGCGYTPCAGKGGECPGKMKAPGATPLRDRILAALAEGAAEFVACGYPHCSGDRGHMANAIERLLAQPDVLALLRAQSEAKVADDRPAGA